MTETSFDINKAIAEVEGLVAADHNLSPALRASIKALIMVVRLLSDRVGLNSRNSSKPPSSDPDDIQILRVDRRTLPKSDYHEAGYESRQVFDIRIGRHVTEYRAQILIDTAGKKFVADFPSEQNRPAQYGAQVKANAVYMSM